MWYTVSRFKKIILEAENQTEADNEAWSIAMDSDTSTWDECDDSNFEIDIDEVKP